MKFSPLILAGLVSVACLVDLPEAKAGPVQFISQTETVTSWNGFGSDFAPYWVGQTTVVQTTPKTKQAVDSLLGGTWGTLMGGRLVLDYVGPQWTVNKISSSSRVVAQTDADFSLAGTPFTASSGDSSSANAAQFARYAQIVTDDGRLLANASALAYQSASLQDRSFSASGQVSAAAILKSGDASANSEATGTSGFTAMYWVQKNTPFSFSLDMAELNDVDLVFSAIESRSGKVLWDLSPSQSGKLFHSDWSGILDPGEYTFSLHAATDALATQDAVTEIGGQAIYDVSLEFQAESYLPSYGSAFPEKPKSLVLAVPAVLQGTNASSALDVPEPGTAILLLLAALCCAMHRRP